MNISVNICDNDKDSRLKMRKRTGRRAHRDIDREIDSWWSGPLSGVLESVLWLSLNKLKMTNKWTTHVVFIPQKSSWKTSEVEEGIELKVYSLDLKAQTDWGRCRCREKHTHVLTVLWQHGWQAVCLNGWGTDKFKKRGAIKNTELLSNNLKHKFKF